MPKLIKKSKCSFENGHIIKKNKVIGIPSSVYYQLDKLEVMVQQWRYWSVQKPACPAPSLEGWKRKSGLASERPYVDTPKTPTIDERVKEAMSFMAEVDAIEKADKINELIDEFGDLIDWCANPKFIEGDNFNAIDLYELGNPLLMEPEDIITIIEAFVDEE